MRHDDDITIECGICGDHYLPWHLSTAEFGSTLICEDCSDEVLADARDILDICD